MRFVQVFPPALTDRTGGRQLKIGLAVIPAAGEKSRPVSSTWSIGLVMLLRSCGGLPAKREAEVQSLLPSACWPIRLCEQEGLELAWRR
jgi:hypothetical protein